MNKILTIIIPTYNMEKYLRRCLDSLIIDEEGMKQLEVLVINDGSKDSSSEIAHEYQDKYPDTYRVIDKENGNYGSCINRGLKEATGKYVKVLDADDWFDNKSLRYFVSKLLTCDVDLILSNCVIMSNDKPHGGFFIRNIRSEKILEFKEISKTSVSIQMHCVCYRLSMLREINYQQSVGVSYTDQQWVCLPLSAVKTLIFIDLDLYKYMVDREGQTMDRNVINKKFADEVTMISQMIKWSEQTPHPICNDEYIRKKVEWHTCNLFFNHIVRGLYDDKEFDVFANNISDSHKWLYERIRKKNVHLGVPYKYIGRFYDKRLSVLPFHVRVGILISKHSYVKFVALANRVLHMIK